MHASTMCGLELSELRISLADCASSNERAAVLLDPVICATVVRSRASAARELTNVVDCKNTAGHKDCHRAGDQNQFRNLAPD